MPASEHMRRNCMYEQIASLFVGSDVLKLNRADDPGHKFMPQ